MAFGFGVLRRSSKTFWAMTPRELAAAVAALRGDARPVEPLSRAALETLIADYPDEVSTWLKK